MGHNTLYAAMVFSLLGAVSALHAEEAATAQPAASSTAVEAPPPSASSPTPAAEATKPTESATTPLTPEALLKPTPAAAPVDAPVPVEKRQGDTLSIPKAAAPEASVAPEPAAAPKPAVAPKPAETKGKPALMPHHENGMPVRGATMKDVEKHFGKPNKKLAPVGKPPITRWVYDNYTVYFEHQYVIETVKNKAPPLAPAKAPPMMQKQQLPSSPAGAAPATTQQPRSTAPATSAKPTAGQPADTVAPVPDTTTTPAVNETTAPMSPSEAPAGTSGEVSPAPTK